MVVEKLILQLVYCSGRSLTTQKRECGSASYMPLHRTLVGACLRQNPTNLIFFKQDVSLDRRHKAANIV